eukprot:scaffold207403_cov31-Tisochrysis_lutea.AAC.2
MKKAHPNVVKAPATTVTPMTAAAVAILPPRVGSWASVPMTIVPAMASEMPSSHPIRLQVPRREITTRNMVRIAYRETRMLPVARSSTTKATGAHTPSPEKRPRTSCSCDPVQKAFPFVIDFASDERRRTVEKRRRESNLNEAQAPIDEPGQLATRRGVQIDPLRQSHFKVGTDLWSAVPDLKLVQEAADCRGVNEALLERTLGSRIREIEEVVKDDCAPVVAWDPAGISRSANVLDAYVDARIEAYSMVEVHRGLVLVARLGRRPGIFTSRVQRQAGRRECAPAYAWAATTDALGLAEVDLPDDEGRRQKADGEKVVHENGNGSIIAEGRHRHDRRDSSGDERYGCSEGGVEDGLGGSRVCKLHAPTV